MRVMLDSLDPNDIPAQPVGVLIAAYLGHASNPQSYAQAVARFPGHQIVSIASHNAVDAQVLDVEHLAVEPTDYPTINNWCVRQRARGVKPTIYCNESTWPTVLPHIVGSVNWWAANWSNGPAIPPNAVGVQYTGVPGYDISILQDFIDGIDGGLTPSGGGTPIGGNVTQPLDSGQTFNADWANLMPASAVPPSAAGSPMFWYLADIWNKVTALETRPTASLTDAQVTALASQIAAELPAGPTSDQITAAVQTALAGLEVNVGAVVNFTPKGTS